MSNLQKIGENKRGKPFQKGEGGRPKGIQNKNTRLVKEVFINVFSELQDEKKTNLKEWAKENPGEFYKLISKLFPIQIGNEDGSGTFKVTLNLNQ
jgi:hypothetical protein